MSTMNKLNIEVKSIENAPEASQDALKAAKAAYGFEANLLGAMANHPALLNSYLQGSALLDANSTLSPIEQQVAFLTVSYENNCHYCMAAHSTIGQMTKVPQEVIDSLRNGTPIADPKLEALRQYVKATTINRGRVSDDDIQNFLAAGFNEEQILEVITIVGFKVFTNYINYLVKTPVDDAFQANSWEPRV